MEIDLSSVPTPKLKAIMQILEVGVPANAETAELDIKDQLCHKNPPKGYPKDKSDYGDPACYRYPLNTKAECLAAWRYVHHAENRNILSGKFKKVESKIKSYAKSHYDLDLQVGESNDFDWAKAFMEYYDAETMGERCENIVLEPDSSAEDKKIMEYTDEEIKALEKEVKELRTDSEKWVNWETEKADLVEKATQLDTLTKELSDQNEELENLRQFKSDTEKAAEKAERIKDIKSKLEEAGLEANFDDEAEVNYWLNIPDDILSVTISKMGEMKKGADASASKKIEVPDIPGSEETDALAVVRDGLKERKQS